jgi:hypothetical protein
MKHLKRYKLFEVKSKYPYMDDYTQDPTEEDFQAIADTLQSEVFDEYDIPFLSHEEFERLDNLQNTTGEEDLDFKYWQYAYDRYGKMRQINICNLMRKEFDGITMKLRDIHDTVKGRTGYTMDWISDSGNEESGSDGNYVIIIKVK